MLFDQRFECSFEPILGPSPPWLLQWCEYGGGLGHRRLQDGHILPERVLHHAACLLLTELVTRVVQLLVLADRVVRVLTPLDPRLPFLAKRDFVGSRLTNRFLSRVFSDQ